nr:MAG TPA: hypothetical protein [Caudoviricetes sp.]
MSTQMGTHMLGYNHQQRAHESVHKLIWVDRLALIHHSIL